MSTSIEIRGRVEKLLESETFGSGFTKRILVVKTDEKYPQSIAIEFGGKKLEELEDELTELQEGQWLTVSVNIRGSEWNGRYFVNLSGWRVRAADPPQESDGFEESVMGQGDDDFTDPPF